MLRLPAGKLRTLHVNRKWITTGVEMAIIVSEQDNDGRWVESTFRRVKVLGPSELVPDFHGAGAHHTVHLVTTSELEVS